jgi:hypothetical protein
LGQSLINETAQLPKPGVVLYTSRLAIQYHRDTSLSPPHSTSDGATGKPHVKPYRTVGYPLPDLGVAMVDLAMMAPLYVDPNLRHQPVDLDHLTRHKCDASSSTKQILQCHEPTIH